MCKALVGRSRAELWAVELRGFTPLDLVRIERRSLGRRGRDGWSEAERAQESRREAVEVYLKNEMRRGVNESN